MFIHFWESMSMREVGAEREGARRSEAGSALIVASPVWGWNSRTMRWWMTWAKVRHWVTQASLKRIFYFYLLIFYLFIFIYFIFIYLLRERERERECTQVGERDWGRERILIRLHAQCGAQHQAQSHDPWIMTWAEIKSWTLNLNQLSHPGTPLHQLFND